MKLHKRGTGTYSTHVRFVEYFVAKFPSGWRWFRGGDASVGGEWRSTKAEAVKDLAAYLYREN